MLKLLPEVESRKRAVSNKLRFFFCVSCFYILCYHSREKNV